MGRIILLNNMRRILLLVLFSTISVVGTMAQIANGYCGGEGDGTNLTWVLDENGTLTISGSGEMDDYDIYSDDRPWKENGDIIKTIRINDGVKSIGDCAFYDFNSIMSVVLPQGVERIGNYAFFDCTNLNAINLPEGLTELGYNVFKMCENLTEIVVPKGVTKIPYCAFDDCYALTSVVLPDGLVSIEEEAFQFCNRLSSINIPESIEHIAYNAFEGCYSLPIIDNIRYADTYLIELLDKTMSNYTILEGTRLIASSAFEQCKNLTAINIPEGVERISDNAFSGCAALFNISLPKSLKYIGDNVFQGCSALTCIELPDGLTNIGYGSFKECSALTTINIPMSITSIGMSAFEGCRSLPIVDNIRYADSYLIEMIDKAASTCIIKPDTRFIASSSFENCKNIKSVSLPNGLLTIGRAAFSGCSSLTTITFPGTLKSIDENAFHDCNFKSVVSLATVPAVCPDESYIYDLLFEFRTYNHAPLYIPEGRYWDYAFAPGWGEFTQIKEMAMDESALQSRQAYMIADAKGFNYTVYDTDKDELVNVEYTHSLDEESEGSCWTVLKDGGKSFLYNIGAKKFASMDNDGKLTLSDAPVNMNITATENGLSINGKSCMFVLNKNINVDATGIESVFCDTEFSEKSDVYTIDGRRIDKAVRGINIVNGNKVLVK